MSPATQITCEQLCYILFSLWFGWGWCSLSGRKYLPLISEILTRRSFFFNPDINLLIINNIVSKLHFHYCCCCLFVYLYSLGVLTQVIIRDRPLATTGCIHWSMDYNKSFQIFSILHLFLQTDYCYRNSLLPLNFRW